jgi:hypothetical protein
MTKTTTMIDRVGSAFEERNAFLNVALGLTSVLRRALPVLRRHARPAEKPASPSLPIDDQTLHLALGVISLARSLRGRRALLGASASRPHAGPRSAAPAPTSSLRRILE